MTNEKRVVMEEEKERVEEHDSSKVKALSRVMRWTAFGLILFSFATGMLLSRSVALFLYETSANIGIALPALIWVGLFAPLLIVSFIVDLLISLDPLIDPRKIASDRVHMRVFVLMFGVIGVGIAYLSGEFDGLPGITDIASLMR